MGNTIVFVNEFTVESTGADSAGFCVGGCVSVGGVGSEVVSVGECNSVGSTGITGMFDGLMSEGCGCCCDCCEEISSGAADEGTP